MSYLVIGATGNVGGEVVAQLSAQGHGVRALVRDADRAAQLPAGIEIAVGDLDDAESLTAAATGVEGVFYLQLMPVPAQAELMVKAARSAGVSRIVLMSSMGTKLFPAPMIGARIAARDAVFRASDLDVTYLYAGGLMSNALWWIPEITADGQVADPTEPGHVGVVDPYDVARVAALALAQDGHSGHGYLLTGPESLTPGEQVKIFADVLGTPIEFRAITPEESTRLSIERGMDAGMAAARQNLNELFRADRASVLTDEVQNLTGTAPRTFRQWCEQHADAIKRQLA